MRLFSGNFHTICKKLALGRQNICLYKNENLVQMQELDGIKRSYLYPKVLFQVYIAFRATFKSSRMHWTNNAAFKGQQQPLDSPQK